MRETKTYIYNSRTDAYELHRPSVLSYLARVAGVVAMAALCFALYSWIYTDIFGFRSPKTFFLTQRNSRLLSKVELINQRLDNESAALQQLQMRDNVVYRPIFGMEEIPQDVRNAGFGGVDRYARFKGFYNSELLTSSAMKMDILTKKAYIQSKSFDDVQLLSRRANDMASCIPTIFPVSTNAKNHISSRFGYRPDPFTGSPKFHSGVDIAGPLGEPVYVTGDGTVAEVGYNFYGYGNFIIVDHGFGYRTRYAHLKTTGVIEGQTVRRGDQIGTMGSTGRRSTGSHLHYEVSYKGLAINPWNFFDSTIDPEDYALMVRPVSR